jgi:biotin carboxylase
MLVQHMREFVFCRSSRCSYSQRQIFMSLNDCVTHVLVGYGAAILPELEARLPERSVLIVDEPAVIEARGVRGQTARFRCVAGVVEAPTQDDQHPDAVVAALPRPPRVRAVIPGVEYGVVGAAALAEAWGLPGAGLAAARVFRDKALLRTLAGGAGIAQPRWAVVAGPEEVEAFRTRHGAACVIKPANRQASLGVQLLGPGDDAHALWAHTVEASEPKLRADYDGAARFLVEQRVYGSEVSVEVIVRQGVTRLRNITAKTVQGSRFPVELAHTVPAALPPATVEALYEAQERLVTASGFRDGVLHAEWILGDDVRDGGPYLVECAGRLPGDGIPALIDLAYGGSFIGDLLGVLEGGDGPAARDATAGAAVRFLSAPAGVVEAVLGEDEARRAVGVHTVHVSAVPGARVGEATSSWERAGHVVATGADGAAAALNADAAAGRITFVCADSPQELLL